jgi:hypothetical protein
MHVELDDVGAHPDRVLEGSEGVLVVTAVHVAPMRRDERECRQRSSRPVAQPPVRRERQPSIMGERCRGDGHARTSTRARGATSRANTIWPQLPKRPAGSDRETGMATITATAATPPPPGTSSPLPPPLPTPSPDTATTGTRSVRNQVTSWMEARLGKAAFPVAALAGGALGGTLGFLTLGPVGGLAGGIGGALLGGVLFMAG